jgi:hypothetical protein
MLSLPAARSMTNKDLVPEQHSLQSEKRREARVKEI